MVPREAVIWGYRLILGREPENETVIDGHGRLRDITALRLGLFNSQEFSRKNLISKVPRVWVAAPVMSGERLIWIDLGDQFVSRACLFDNYEPVETQFIKSVLNEGDVFVDVGANVGWFTLLASTIVGKSGKIHAFEPRKETGDYLEKTIKLNNLKRQVSVHRCALFDFEGEGLLGWAKQTNNPGGSFLTNGALSEGMETQPIATRTLDQFELKQLDFLKVDVEGAEMRVFLGGRATLERCRPIILSELSPEMLERGSAVRPEAFFGFFYQIGYRCFIVDARHFGEEITEFPATWHKSLLNVGLIPKERPVKEFLSNIISGK